MRMFYAQHNPPIFANAPFIRVIHLRKSKGSFFLNDLDDKVQNIRTQYKIPSYIPFGKTIDILMVDRALTSYQQGAIRNLMNKGEISAFILVNKDVVQSEIGEVYDVNLTQSLVTIDTSGGAAFVTLPTENIPEGWEIEIKKTTSDLNQIQLDAGTGDIEGSGPMYVVAGEQEAVKLTYNLGTWWVLTKSSGAGGVGPPGKSAYEVAVDNGFVGTEEEWLESLVGAPGEGESLRDYLFANSFFVPDAGTLYLESDGVNTASVPLTLNVPSVLRSMSVRVNEVDNVRTYDMEVRVNDTVTDTLTLPLSTLYASATNLSTVINVGDAIVIRLVKTSGAGSSSFNNIRATLEMVES